MARLITRMVLAVLFLFAGTWHLANPQLFLPIMPPWIPAPMSGIIISGIALLLAGIALLLPIRDLQRAAGWGLLLLLAAIFPANIYMAAAHVQIHGFPSNQWMNWARLPLQPVIMVLVSWASGIWPKPQGEGNAAAPSTDS